MTTDHLQPEAPGTSSTVDAPLASTAGELRELLERLGDLDPVGVDVERADGDRYYRYAALIQVGGSGRAVLADPLAVRPMTELDRFLADRAAVLHALDNDLGPLAGVDVRPARVEDTAVAAGLLGLPTGLDPLLTEVLGVERGEDKQRMQRADWSQRPLDERMRAYAAGDVAWLPRLWGELEGELRRRGRLTWYDEELEAVVALPEPHERRSWHQVKGAGRLDDDARARLHALWHAREASARDADVAPGLVCPDKVLVAAAEQPPSDPGGLVRLGVRRRMARRFGQQLRAAAVDCDPPPEPTGRAGRPSRAERELAGRLRDLRNRTAEQLGIEPGVLCPNRLLDEAVVRRGDADDDAALRARLGLRRWQWGVLGEGLCEVLEVPVRTGAGRDRTKGRRWRRR